jgi:hypothetical protein
MTQIRLAGQGGPIPNVALPDPNIDLDLPVQTLELANGQIFRKEDWLNVGYTRYEVWCIGAAGGKGGDGGGRYVYSESGPSDYLALSWPYYFTQHPSKPPGYLLAHWHHPYIGPKEIQAHGGAGGGGGLHVVSGLLSDLPDASPVVVGQTGADAVLGQLIKPVVVHTSYADTPGASVEGAYDVYDLPHLSFSPPMAGGDGGTSSFNGTLCQASGGKGGQGCAKWVGNLLMITGYGGDGGSGGRSAPGGGGAGSLTDSNGSDGTWDGSIGKGGGGGRGGIPRPEAPNIPGSVP